MAERVYVRASREQVVQKLRQLGGMLSGRIADPYGLARAFQLRLGTSALSVIKEDFATKARGGVGRDGIAWPPLSPVTLALRNRTGAGSAKVVAQLRQDYSSMPEHRRKLIKEHYNRVLALYRADAKGDVTGAKARKHARYILDLMRKEIPTSRFIFLKHTLEGDLPAERAERLAFFSAWAEMLRDTGVLLNSLSPGVDGPGHPEQIFELTAGSVIVGTNVPYAIFHHSYAPRKLKKDGNPKLPQRAFWPESNFPDGWWAPVIDGAMTGIEIVVKALTRAA